MNEYYTKGQPCNEPLPAPSTNGVKPILKPPSLIAEQYATAPIDRTQFRSVRASCVGSSRVC